jgi:hypothetical protein
MRWGRGNRQAQPFAFVSLSVICISIRKMIEASAIACMDVASWVDALKVASQIRFAQDDRQ